MAETKKARSAIPKGGNDDVNTPDDLALAIVEHFAPSGVVCDPCQGGGAFYRAFASYDDRHPGRLGSWMGFDIKDGHDFLEFSADPDPAARWDWIITNEPWSLFLPFLRKGMELSRNIVFLDKLNAWTISSRLNAMKAAGFEFREIATVKQPPPPWPQMGFQFAAVHIALSPDAPFLDGRPGKLGRPLISEIDWTPPPKVRTIRSR